MQTGRHVERECFTYQNGCARVVSANPFPTERELRPPFAQHACYVQPRHTHGHTHICTHKETDCTESGRARLTTTHPRRTGYLSLSTEERPNSINRHLLTPRPRKTHPTPQAAPSALDAMHGTKGSTAVRQHPAASKGHVAHSRR